MSGISVRELMSTSEKKSAAGVRMIEYSPKLLESEDESPHNITLLSGWDCLDERCLVGNWTGKSCLGGTVLVDGQCLDGNCPGGWSVSGWICPVESCLGGNCPGGRSVSGWELS